MNKILQQFRIFIVPALFIFNHVNCFAQNRYGVNVIENKNAYKRSILQDSSKKMVELKSVIPDIVYDLRYATTNNFMRRRMYKGNFQTFLRRPAAEALSKVQQELKTLLHTRNGPYHIASSSKKCCPRFRRVPITWKSKTWWLLIKTIVSSIRTPSTGASWVRKGFHIYWSKDRVMITLLVFLSSILQIGTVSIYTIRMQDGCLAKVHEHWVTVVYELRNSWNWPIFW